MLSEIYDVYIEDQLLVFGPIEERLFSAGPDWGGGGKQVEKAGRVVVRKFGGRPFPGKKKFTVCWTVLDCIFLLWHCASVVTIILYWCVSIFCLIFTTALYLCVLIVYFCVFVFTQIYKSLA